MTVGPYKRVGNRSQSSAHKSAYKSAYSAVPSNSVIIREAERAEALLRKLMCASPDDQTAWEICAAQYPKLKSLNSFAKQIVIRMFRSNPTFQGFKAEFKDPVLKSHVLFLLGTLCDEFDHIHTSPLYGMSVLDVGCGALSPYGTPDDKNGLTAQFYSEYPPIGAEILQILGAQTIGIDPRINSKEHYDYQVSYKHRAMEFIEIPKFLTTVKNPFDVMVCFNLFNRSGFAFYYSEPHEISGFLKMLKGGLSPQGLLYCNAPFLPSSPENRQLNEQVFIGAGLKVVYEGYFLVLQPA